MRNFLILMLVLLSACSVNQTQRRSITNISVEKKISLTFTPDRVCIDPIYHTTYLLDRNMNKIQIYRDGDFVNTIGGSGSTRTRFQRLADITIATDGGLFTLDSAARQIRKYDRNGQLITEWKLDAFKRPERFVSDKENNFYIFDFFGRTISFYNTLNNSVDFDFGRFTLSNVSAMDFIDNRLVVKEALTSKTFVFSSIGKQLDELSGDFTIDRYGNHILLKPNWIEIKNGDTKYCLSIDEFLSIRSTGDIIYCTKQGGYTIVKVHYSEDYEG